MARYASIWFPYLMTDYLSRKNPKLRGVPLITATPRHGRMVVVAANDLARAHGIQPQMAVADCKAILPELQVVEAEAEKQQKLLHSLAEWCIRFTPLAAVDPPDGLILDTTGCTHLWGGETSYLADIGARFRRFGYRVNSAIADTIGAAWATAHFGNTPVVPGNPLPSLINLPPAALRLDDDVLARLRKLGLNRIGNFIQMPRNALRRRFGPSLVQRIAQALGEQPETIQPVKPIEPYQERLPCVEPVRTAIAIEIALTELLEKLCARLEKEDVGFRKGVFQAYRIDGQVQQIGIGTGHPSQNPQHLFKLFEIKIGTFEPGLGFELFILEATGVEPASHPQQAFWATSYQDDNKISELLDRLAARTGETSISRYLPATHHWPERSIRKVASMHEKPATPWRTDLTRPVHLLPYPERIEVTAPVPDYPPMLFLHKGKRYQVAKADGPERIEQEWWLEEGTFRDYYCVEDPDGKRFWLFRAGAYDDENAQWFIHGFFA